MRNSVSGEMSAGWSCKAKGDMLEILFTLMKIGKYDFP
jgi:hypothetical protein